MLVSIPREKALHAAVVHCCATKISEPGFVGILPQTGSGKIPPQWNEYAPLAMRKVIAR